MSDLCNPLQLCVGSQPHHRLGEQGWSTRVVPAAPCLGSLHPHSHNPFASPGAGGCSSAAPVPQRAPTGTAPSGPPAETRGSATPALVRALVRGKELLATGLGPDKAWQRVLRVALPRSLCPTRDGSLSCPWGCVFILLSFLSLLTASRTNSELASPSTPSQELSVPSHGFTGPDNTSSGPASQAASSPSQLPD